MTLSSEIMMEWKEAVGESKEIVARKIFSMSPQDYDELTAFSSMEQRYRVEYDRKEVVRQIDRDMRLAYGMIQDFRCRFIVSRELYKIKDLSVNNMFDISSVLNGSILNYPEAIIHEIQDRLIVRIEEDNFPVSVKSLFTFDWQHSKKATITETLDLAIKVFPTYHKFFFNTKEIPLYAQKCAKLGISYNAIIDLFAFVEFKASKIIKDKESIDLWFNRNIDKLWGSSQNDR